MSNNDLLTVAELSEKLKVSGSTIRRMARAGILPYTKVGRPYRFIYEEVLSALNKYNKKRNKK